MKSDTGGPETPLNLYTFIPFDRFTSLYPNSLFF